MTYDQTMAALTAAQKDERRDLRRRVWFVGVAMLFSLAVELVLAFMVGDFFSVLEAQMDVSALHRVAYYVVYGGYYCGILLLPVAVVALLFRQKPLLPRACRREVSAWESLLLIAFGWGFCVLANYLTNYWLIFIEQFGVEPFLGNYHNEKGWLPLLLNLITYALLPGVVEELLYRGWLLGALQPCGERRAWVLSALLFGLAHGNLTQLPFAMLLGLLFGYLYLHTGRLWLGMVVHFLNNALSVVLDYTAQYLSENVTMVVQMTVFGVLVAVGALAGVLLTAGLGGKGAALSLPERRHLLPSGERARRTWGNPAVLLAILVYAVLTVLGEVVR